MWLWVEASFETSCLWGSIEECSRHVFFNIDLHKGFLVHMFFTISYAPFCTNGKLSSVKLARFYIEKDVCIKSLSHGKECIG